MDYNERKARHEGVAPQLSGYPPDHSFHWAVNPSPLIFFFYSPKGDSNGSFRTYCHFVYSWYSCVTDCVDRVAGYSEWGG